MEDNKETNNQDSSKVINKDEIESLVGEKTDAGIQAIVNSALVSYERLPMLEVIFDRLVRRLTTSLRNFTSDNVEVSLDGMDTARFEHHLNTIGNSSMLAIFKADQWDNFGLLVVNSDLIYSMVDVLLGGRRGGVAELNIEDRAYTTIERSLVETLVDVVLKDLGKAFRPLSHVDFVYERLETNPRFATIARPDNAVITINLKISMEERGGTLGLLLPYATLEPVRELLLQRFLGEKFGRDTIWESHLATELWATKVTMNAVLDTKVMELGDVMNLEIGQTVMFNCTNESDVLLNCGDVPLMIGKMGRIGKTVAIKITDEIQKNDRELNLDEKQEAQKINVNNNEADSLDNHTVLATEDKK